MSEEWIWIGNDGERMSASTIEELEKKVGRFKTVFLQEKEEKQIKLIKKLKKIYTDDKAVVYNINCD